MKQSNYKFIPSNIKTYNYVYNIDSYVELS